MNRAEQVRQILAELGEATVAELAQRLDLPLGAGRQKVRETLKDLVKGGRAEAAGDGRYRLTGAGPRRGDIQAKLWRAVVIRQQGFSVREVALLAEADPDYAKRYVRHLERLQVVQRVGRQGNRLMYRAAAALHLAAAPVRYRRRAEEKKERQAEAANCRCRQGPSRVGEILTEMREALALATAHNEQAQELLLQMEQELGGVGGGEEEHAGPDAHES